MLCMAVAAVVSQLAERNPQSLVLWRGHILHRSGERPNLRERRKACSEIWAICGHRLQGDVTLKQEALGTSAQVCQISAVSQDGQSLPAESIWA